MLMTSSSSGRMSSIIALLEAKSRVQPLSLAEVLQLERAIIRSGTCRRQRWWTKGEVRRLKRLLDRGKKPRHIAPILGRTERSVWRMIYRQKWTVRGMGPVFNRPADDEAGE